MHASPTAHAGFAPQRQVPPSQVLAETQVPSGPGSVVHRAIAAGLVDIAHAWQRATPVASQVAAGGGAVRATHAACGPPSVVPV